MGDFDLNWQGGAADLSIVDDDLASDEGLRTAMLLSLFTDRRAEDDDILPDDSGDRRGWWGDEHAEVQGDRHGSRLWLLERSKRTPSFAADAEEYASEALAWLIDDRVCERIDVVAEVFANGYDLLVTPHRPEQDPVSFRFSHVWEGEAARVAAEGAVGATAPNEPPTAAFAYVADGLEVTFTDESTDGDGSIASWLWDFGDGPGNTSTEQNPTHEYASPGDYNVTLTVTDNAGLTDDAEDEVSVESGGDPWPTSGAEFLEASGDSAPERLTVAPIALWRFNHATTITDLSGNGHHLTVNGPSLIASVPEFGGWPALRFAHNSSDHCELTSGDASVFDYDPTDDESLAYFIWARVHTPTVGTQSYLGKRTIAGVGFSCRSPGDDEIATVWNGYAVTETTDGSYEDGEPFIHVGGYRADIASIINATDREAAIVNGYTPGSDQTSPNPFRIGAFVMGGHTLERKSVGMDLVMAGVFSTAGAEQGFTQAHLQALMSSAGL